ncbi:hypothetical protein [Devosia sp. 2618]|uniref:hypothetical protein n=1 Tax=Devosia sp. 2618 TaxID=3156454 RepID=UPI00339446D2
MRLATFLLASATLVSPTFAADLGVLKSLDLCDTLGVSGLTLSSSSNCLQVSAELTYEFRWGDYKGDRPVLGSSYSTSIDWNAPDGNANDWDSWLDVYLTAVGTSSTDFGPAKATIVLYGYEYNEVQNLVPDPSGEFSVDEAYFSVGDQTVLTAGIRGTSVFNSDDDDAFGWLDSFISYETGGVAFDGGKGKYGTEGHVIQLTHNLGGGFTTGIALENLDEDGSLIGVLNYGSDTLTAHISVLAGGVLDGSLDDLAIHTGVTAIFDAFKLRGAFAATNDGWWNALASAETTIDMFTLAATIDGTSERELGLVASASAKLNDSFTVKLAARYLDADTTVNDDEGAEIRARVEYKATEALTLAAEAGHLWTGANAPSGTQSITDGLLELTWAPGGNFEATTAIAANTIGAYKLSFTATKSYE